MANDIRRYIVDLEEQDNPPLKDTTIHARCRGVKAWLNWLVAEGELEKSPFERVRMPRIEKRIPPPFSPDEIRRLVKGCDRHTRLGRRNYAMILVLLDTGLRATEFVSPKANSINMRDGQTTVMGKGRKQRTIIVGDRARSAILTYLGTRGEVGNTDPLWLAYTRTHKVRGALSKSGLQTVLRRLGRQTDVHPCAPHRFRRTFALWCLRDGMDLERLRELMGHNSLHVLERYLRMQGEDLLDAHRRHSPVDNMEL